MSSMFPNNLTSGTSSSATSSSYEGSYYPWQAFDGSNTTKWGPGDTPTTTYPQWLQRDLGKAYPIDSVVVNFDSSVERWTQGSLQGSNDGTTFTELATYSNNTNTTLTLIPNDTTTPYRYIRFVGTGRYAGYGKITEMQIYVTAESNPGVRIQLRHDTTTNWSLVNPVLLEGEIGLETDTNQMKMGNGVDDWNTLEYAGPQVIVDQTYNSASANAQSGTAIAGANFLQNTSTSQYSVCTGGAYTRNTEGNIFIGYQAGSSSYGQSSVAIGEGASASNNTGYDVIIGRQAEGNYYSSGKRVAIGYYSKVLGTGSIAIGSTDSYSSRTTAGYSNSSGSNTGGIAIGWKAQCNTESYSNNNGIAIGASAIVQAAHAIQLGYGTNSTANTFSVGFQGQNSGTPYTLLDGTTGLIPTARVPGSVSMPDTSQITTLTVPTSATSMTNNLGDGWLYLAATQTDTNGYAFMSIDNTYELLGQPTNVNGFEIRLLMPIKNGSTYELTYSSVNIFYFAFFKAIGG